MSRKVVIGVVAILLIAGSFIVRAVTIENEPTAPVPAAGTIEEQQIMHQQFPDLPESNRFVTESADQIMDRFESGTGIIFLGFKECPWCQKMAPIINEAAETGGATIYYLDIKRLSEDDSIAYRTLVSNLTPYLPKNANGQPHISTPDISFVRDGEIIWRYEMDTTTEAERTPDAYWTEARKVRTLQRFLGQIEKLRN